MGTIFSGALADALGVNYAYGAIALVGLAATALARLRLRETRGPTARPHRAQAT